LAAANDFAAENAGLTPDDCPILQVALFSKTGLAAHDYMLAELARAGKSDLRSHYRVGADLAVVADVHKIIQFNAFADARVVERAAIDCCVRADFDIVGDFHDAHLGKLPVAAFSCA
jgi:hypothetical protein